MDISAQHERCPFIVLSTKYCIWTTYHNGHASGQIAAARADIEDSRTFCHVIGQQLKGISVLQEKTKQRMNAGR